MNEKARELGMRSTRFQTAQVYLTATFQVQWIWLS